jgi:PEP-CTERM motif
MNHAKRNPGIPKRPKPQKNAKVVLGQVVGGGVGGATEWSHGSVIILGGLPGSDGSLAYGINDSGMVVGLSRFPVIPPPPIPVPEPSTWAMMLAGFAGLGFAS